MSQLALGFVPRADAQRLGKQQCAVESFMLGLRGAWVTLDEVARATGAPPASVSARLRTMRARGFTVDRKRSAPGSGLWLYRVRQEVSRV